jgi:hypothetical protein
MIITENWLPVVERFVQTYHLLRRVLAHHHIVVIQKHVKVRVQIPVVVPVGVPVIIPAIIPAITHVGVHVLVHVRVHAPIHVIPVIVKGMILKGKSGGFIVTLKIMTGQIYLKG